LVAKRSGKTAHALMIETLERAMFDSNLQHQFHLDGRKAHAQAVRTGQVYAEADVERYFSDRIQGKNPARPRSVALAGHRRIPA
jgi:succinylglutamate desuccinylase